MAQRLGALHDALLNPGDKELAVKAAKGVAEHKGARYEASLHLTKSGRTPRLTHVDVGFSDRVADSLRAGQSRADAEPAVKGTAMTGGGGPTTSSTELGPCGSCRPSRDKSDGSVGHSPGVGGAYARAC
jgi:hypothetical protein